MFYSLKEKKPNIVIALDPDAYLKAIEIYMTLQAIYGFENEDRIKVLKINDKLKRDIDQIRREDGEDKIIEIVKSARTLTTNDYFIRKKYEKRKNRFTYKAYTK